MSTNRDLIIEEKLQSGNIKFCEKLLKFSHPTEKRILDIGCGDGSLLKFIADCYKPQEIIGIEPSLNGWWSTEESEGDNWKIKSGNVLSLDFPDNYFDLAISASTFEHIGDLEKALSEIKRVIKPYGKFYTLFAPLWTSVQGHHFIAQGDTYWNETHLLAIPPWGHLYLSEDEMHNHLEQQCIDADMINEMLHFIYHSDLINRMPRTKVLDAIMNCGMIVRCYREVIDFSRLSAAKLVTHPPKEIELTFEILEQTSRNGYSPNDLGVVGMEVCLEKYAAY